jgi:hypothetical protein
MFENRIGVRIQRVFQPPDCFIVIEREFDSLLRSAAILLLLALAPLIGISPYLVQRMLQHRKLIGPARQAHQLVLRIGRADLLRRTPLPRFFFIPRSECCEIVEEPIDQYRFDLDAANLRRTYDCLAVLVARHARRKESTLSDRFGKILD